MEHVNPLQPGIPQHGPVRSRDYCWPVERVPLASCKRRMVYHTVQRQAAMMAFVDNFHMLGIVFFIVIPVLMFLKRPQRE